MFSSHKIFLTICVLSSATVIWCDSNNSNSGHRKKNNNKAEQQSNQEVWEQDLTDSFKIEGTDQGIQKVNLKCGSNSMNVVLETEKPFTGVMYTRGSFYKQTPPCFIKPNPANERSIQMNFQLDECQTQKEGELYSNIVVIQNDPEVITPGDSAFSLECDFRQSKNIDVEANMQTRDRIAIGSKITLRSPDPSAYTNDKNTSSDFHTNTKNSAHSNTNTVQYIPVNKKLKEDDAIRLGTVEEVTLTLERNEL